MEALGSRGTLPCTGLSIIQLHTVTQVRFLALTWTEKGNKSIPGENLAGRSSDQTTERDTERPKASFCFADFRSQWQGGIFLDSKQHSQEPGSLPSYATRQAAHKKESTRRENVQSLVVVLGGFHWPLSPGKDYKMIIGSFSRRLRDPVGTRSSHTEQTSISGEYNYETFKPHLNEPLFCGYGHAKETFLPHQQDKVCVGFFSLSLLYIWHRLRCCRLFVSLQCLIQSPPHTHPHPRQPGTMQWRIHTSPGPRRVHSNLDPRHTLK